MDTRCAPHVLPKIAKFTFFTKIFGDFESIFDRTNLIIVYYEEQRRLRGAKQPMLSPSGKRAQRMA